MRDACQLEIERTRSPVSAELTLLLANFTVQYDELTSVVERRCDPYRPPNFSLPPVDQNWRLFKPTELNREQRHAVYGFGAGVGVSIMLGGALFFYLTM